MLNIALREERRYEIFYVVFECRQEPEAEFRVGLLRRSLKLLGSQTGARSMQRTK